MPIMFPPRSTRRKQKNRAFTLLEILIALAIIGLIVGVGVANLDKIFGNAQVDISKSFVQSGVNFAVK